LATGVGNKSEKSTYNELTYLSETFSNIIKRSNEMEESIQENTPIVKKMFIKGLLEGEFASQNDVFKKVREMKFNITEGESCVALFSIDGYSKLSTLERGLTQYNIKTKIESIIDEELSHAFQIEMTDLGEDIIAVLVNINNKDSFDTSITDSLSYIQKKILDKLGFTVTVTVGMKVDKIENIHISYSNCQDLLKYRFVYGYGAYLDNNMVQTAVNKRNIAIDKNTKKIIQTIKTCDSEQMQIEMYEIIRCITDNQYDYIKLTINHLALDIMKSVEPLINSENNTLDFNNIFSNINNIDTLEEVKEWFILYCNGIIRKLEGKKDNKKKDTISMVLSYLEANYHKPELSTEMLSDIVNLTPGYFGKMFNEYMNKSVNEYIIELRMKKAKELLESNSDSVTDIALNLGFSNQSYFISIFKKYYGSTPNQYRIECKKSIYDEE
jgi:two-component system, response regulator YesN